jgi:dipeptidyl aminopeptidase/acylaminoacyl peptidase
VTHSDTSRDSRYTFEQFAATRRYQPALSFSPDGSEIAYSTNTSGQFNLWRQSSDGGYPHQLTTFTERAVRSIAWSPDGETILFTADLHGDEFQQVFRVPARGGRPEQLTDAPQVRHQIGAETVVAGWLDDPLQRQRPLADRPGRADDGRWDGRGAACDAGGRAAGRA